MPPTRTAQPVTPAAPAAGPVAPTAAPEASVARQPIYDRRLDLAGYELLFRPSEADKAKKIDPDAATSSVILNAFAEIGCATSWVTPPCTSTCPGAS